MSGGLTSVHPDLRVAGKRSHHHVDSPIAVQISAPDELTPQLRGDLQLCDAETGELRDLTVSPRALAEYAQRHAALLRELGGYCRERAVPCFTLSSDQPFDAVVLRMFRTGGLLG